MAMLPFNAGQWQTAVQQDVADHSISMARINQAVRRILTLKFQIGLFDHPLVNASKADAAVEAGRDATLQAARESITLLRNRNNLLPLSSTSKLVVTGPNADDMAYQLGGWRVSWQCPQHQRPRVLRRPTQPDPTRDHGPQRPAG